MEHRGNECWALGPFESVGVTHLVEGCNWLALQLDHGRRVVQGLKAMISAEKLSLFEHQVLSDGVGYQEVPVHPATAV